MNGRRLAAMLAAGVALAAMPVVVQAAKPTELFKSAVSPTRGTTATAFTLSVHYRSDKGFAATSVIAMVGGRAVSLRLVAGSATDGKFQATTKLQSGKWPVTFEARSAKGPDATLAGPSISVAAPPPPPRRPKPSAAPTRAPPPPRATPPPGATPRPVKAAPSAPASPRAVPSASSSGRASPAAAVPTSRGSRRPSSSSPSSSPTDQMGGTQSGGTTDASQGSSSGPPLGALLPLALLVVSGGVLAALARRRAEGEVPSADDPLSLPQALTIDGNRPAVGEQTEDPILASMGLGARATQRSVVGAPITKSIRFGRGERPPRPGRSG